MKGLSRRSALSKTPTSEARVRAVTSFFGGASPKSRRSLTSSRYQSQNSPQKNW